jgi:hypothetical protein
MNESLRQYNCLRCRVLSEICGRCDRGNIYCQPCSVVSRRIGLRAANQRYQRTFKGASKHAARQRVYRQKQSVKKDSELKKVTDQGSPLPSVDDVLIKPRNQEVILPASHCHFCGRFVGAWVRNTFYRRRGGDRQRHVELCATSVRSQGP